MLWFVFNLRNFHKLQNVSGNNPKKTQKLNRQERRAYEREQSKKTKRKIDWNKVKKSFISILLVGFSFTVLIFCFSYYVTTDQNSIRTSVAKEPQTTIAKVTFISGKGVRSAEYEYVINGRKYENSTFHSFNGNVGDEICIEYSIKEPNISVYCNEKEIQSVKEDVIIFSIEMLGIMILVSIVLILLQILIGDKKLLAEITSRK